MYGVSFDDVATQAAFAADQKLGFRLLSDPDGGVAAKYGVAMPGRPFARRVTFVIDPAGVIRHVDDKVDVARHGALLVERIRALKG